MSKREPWVVQGFLTTAVTGGTGEAPYTPRQCWSEKEAIEFEARLYRDHGPGMVRIGRRPGIVDHPSATRG